MCSWCYAFSPVLLQLRQQLPDNIELVTLLGGLAPDTEEPMPEAMQQHLKAIWQRIENTVPGTHFNYHFWSPSARTNPRRATYPACRAVIAAKYFNKQDKDYGSQMIKAIQSAYYQQAKNPSNNEVLIELAIAVGLDKHQFEQKLLSQETQAELERQISLSRQLNVHSYPSFVFQIEDSSWPVSIDYHSPEPMLAAINKLLKFS